MSDETGSALAIVPRPSENLLAQVIAAAKDPTVDATKMETLARLVNTQQDREREIEFNQDLNAAMMDMPVISKTGLIEIRDKNNRNLVIQSTRFAKFEDIDRVVRPILQRNRLAIRFDVGEAGGQVSVRPILSHANGHTERGEAMRGPLDTSGSKNNVQGAGSTVSYLKRYTMCAMLNIVTEGVDDDGNLGRGVAINMPFEREQLVLQEAETAFGTGRYLDHFASLGPKDRAWLISSGNHQKFGGQVALPGSGAGGTTPPPASEPTPRREPDPPTGEEPKAKSKAQTPRQWVDLLKADLDKRTSADALDEYWDGKRDALAKLAASDPALEQEAQQAYRDRRDALADGRLV